MLYFLLSITFYFLHNFKGEIWDYIFRLLYERENITTRNTQFSIRSVCKNWLKIFSEILFVEIRITYNSGIRYEGEWKNMKKEGRGKLIDKFHDRVIYEGEFKNNMREGRGKLIDKFHDRVIYEGEFKNNKKDGIGNIYYLDGERYEGEWKSDVRDGKGIHYLECGSRYEGEWKNDLKSGIGIYYYSNGNRYEGEWKYNERHGIGIDYFIIGQERYEGEFKLNKRDGRGIYYYSNGDRYEGKWRNNMKEGKGILFYHDGSKYEGDVWRKIFLSLFEGNYNFNKMTNFSIRIVCKSWLQYFSEISFVGVTLTYEHGSRLETYNCVYEGNWKNLMKEGKGMLFECSHHSRLYIGEFLRNKRNGNGTSYFDGRKEYEGEWKDGLKNGFGISYSGDGKEKSKGIWKNNYYY